MSLVNCDSAVTPPRLLPGINRLSFGLRSDGGMAYPYEHPEATCRTTECRGAQLSSGLVGRDHDGDGVVSQVEKK
jgi:hypothetical protein